jgi:hypothetical protein
MSTSADFYIGLGENARWIGTVERDGSPADLDDRGLFGPAADGEGHTGAYTEDTFLAVVREHVRAVVRDTDVDGHLAEDGDSWPWPVPDSSMTDYVYSYNNGSIHVAESGIGDDGQHHQYQVALHYPNGTRKPVKLPRVS